MDDRAHLVAQVVVKGKEVQDVCAKNHVCAVVVNCHIDSGGGFRFPREILATKILAADGALKGGVS